MAPNVRVGSSPDIGGSGVQCPLWSGKPTSDTLPRNSVSLRSANRRKADAEARPLQCQLSARSRHSATSRALLKRHGRGATFTMLQIVKESRSRALGGIRPAILYFWRSGRIINGASPRAILAADVVGPLACPLPPACRDSLLLIITTASDDTPGTILPNLRCWC